MLQGGNPLETKATAVKSIILSLAVVFAKAPRNVGPRYLFNKMTRFPAVMLYSRAGKTMPGARPFSNLLHSADPDCAG